MNLSCDAAEWSGSGQVTVTLIVADFQMPESSPWAILLDIERVERRVCACCDVPCRALFLTMQGGVLPIASNYAVFRKQRRGCQDLMSRKKAN